MDGHELSSKIIGGAIEAHKALSPELLESAYIEGVDRCFFLFSALFSGKQKIIQLCVLCGELLLVFQLKRSAKPKWLKHLEH